MNNKMLAITLAALALPGLAEARKFTFGVGGLLGFNGDLDVDEVKIEGNGNRGTDDDIESIRGIVAFAETPLNQPNLRVGARLAYITSEGDDSDSDITTIDVGAQGRYLFPQKGFTPFVTGALGLSRFSAEGDFFNVNNDVEAEAWGYHLVLGGGAEWKLDSVSLFGTFTYSRHAGSPEGEEQNTEFTFEDTVLTAFHLTVGVLF
ncbi:MAG: outer membrane protein [Bradymonadia bacterium]